METLVDPLIRASGEESNADLQFPGASLGLSLYVAREIARAHGVSVGVSSNDLATRFEMRITRFVARQKI